VQISLSGDRELLNAIPGVRVKDRDFGEVMSKPTVIEDGGKGPPDPHAGQARYHLQQAIIETLRALVRGYDAQGRISTHFAQFTRHMTQTDARLEVVVGDALAELHKELDHQGERDLFEEERESIVLCALQVAAEAMAKDSGTKGRLSGRQSRLHSILPKSFEPIRR
jgi:hypothetical protein